MWQETEKSRTPLREVMSGSNLRSLAQVFLMMSGCRLVGQPSNVLPSIMIQHLHVPSEMTTSGFFWVSIVLFFGFLTYGIIGQMMGPAAGDHDDRGDRADRRFAALLRDGRARDDGRLGRRHDGIGGRVPRHGAVAMADRDDLYLRALSDASAGERLGHRL